MPACSACPRQTDWAVIAVIAVTATYDIFFLQHPPILPVSSLKMASQSSLPPPRHVERFYFAFGSNLHLGQMAKRCPESRYVGVAILHGWRFQINNRGFANVVPSPGDHVEGLVYRLNRTDEANLDRNEGVPTAYQKYSLPIELFTTPIEHVARAVPQLAKELEASEPYTTQIPLQDQSLTPRGQFTKALVYLSTNHVQESKPRDEYIDRMNAGIIDARKLGVSDVYIRHHLRRYIRDRALPGQSMTSAQRIPENPYQRSRQSSLDCGPRPRLGSLRSKSIDPTAGRGERRQPNNSWIRGPYNNGCDPRQR